MKLLVLSDCHFEFMPDGGQSFCDRYRDFADYDVAVIAGDLCDFKGLSRSLRLVQQTFKQTVYVLGNHELYGSDWGAAPFRVDGAVLKENTPAGCGHVWHLNNGAVNIAKDGERGQRFVGATLWFPMDHEALKLTWTMNDFSLIGGLLQNVSKAHERTKEFLWDTLTKDDVLVTHHLPSWSSVHPKFAGSNLNRFFVGNVEGLIKSRKPKLAIHGHTHESTSYMVGPTRVVCNPYGYHGREVNPNFVERMVIEV